MKANSFWSRVDRSGGQEACWPWTRGRRRNGYGQFTDNSVTPKRTHSTHRLAFELSVGPIPDGLCVLHRCDNPPCCNPAHLWLGTQTENVADRDKKGRTHRKLLPAELVEVRRRAASDPRPHTLAGRLARLYRCSAGTIRNAMGGQSRVTA